MTTGPWYKRLPFIHSRLGRLVVGLNIVSLLILVCGTLVVNEFRRGLIDAYEDSLKSQAQTIGNLIGAVATGEEDEAPHLQPYYAEPVHPSGTTRPPVRYQRQTGVGRHLDR